MDKSQSKMDDLGVPLVQETFMCFCYKFMFGDEIAMLGTQLHRCYPFLLVFTKDVVRN